MADKVLDELNERLWRAIAAGQIKVPTQRLYYGLNNRFTSGLLAYFVRRYRARLEVLKGTAGYYIGTIDPKGKAGPRESIEFWRRRKDAEAALAERKFRQRIAF